MGVGSPRKKTPSRSRVMATPERHSSTRASDSRDSPLPAREQLTPRDITYSHHLPTGRQRQANGRHMGRSLIMWTRPRMTDKLLLHIQYECMKHKIQLPWDAIAHRLHPGSSGTAVVQHLARLRRDLISGGHLVPPLAGKPNGTTVSVDPEIRGFIRQDVHGDDRETTRPVTFAERIDDPKFELPDSFGNDDDKLTTDKMDCDVFDSESEFADSPTPNRRAPSHLARNMSFSGTSFGAHPDGRVVHDTTSMLDHIIPIEDDVFTSPKARRVQDSFVNMADDMHSGQSEGPQQQSPRQRPGMSDQRNFYSGMVPIFTSPYTLGAPTGYIPLHLGHPMFGQPQLPPIAAAQGPEMAMWNHPGPRGPSLAGNQVLEPKLESPAIETSEATQASFEDLVVDRLPSEPRLETHETSSSCSDEKEATDDRLSA